MRPHPERRALIARIEAAIASAVGKRYPDLSLDTLETPQLRALNALLRDLADERRSFARRAQQSPWRAP